MASVDNTYTKNSFYEIIDEFAKLYVHKSKAVAKALMMEIRAEEALAEKNRAAEEDYAVWKSRGTNAEAKASFLKLRAATDKASKTSDAYVQVYHNAKVASQALSRFMADLLNKVYSDPVVATTLLELLSFEMAEAEVLRELYNEVENIVSIRK